MITFEIGTYQVIASAGTNKSVFVYLRDDANQYRGYINFLESSSFEAYTLHSNGIINARMPMSKLRFVLDILRNEDPVSFQVNDTYGFARILTGAEPVGEEESPE